MKIEYDKIEYSDNDNNKKYHSVEKVFCLGIIPKAYGNIEGYFGINIGISVPHTDELEDKEFYDSIFGTKNFKDNGFIEAFLIGKNGEKVPVIIGEANGYEKEIRTSCLFGYLSPLILAADERPKMKYFGSFLKETEYRYIF